MLLQTIKFITDPLFDFIYPPVCFTCEQMLDGNLDKICPECHSQLKALDESFPVWNELRKKFSNSGTIDDFTSCYLFEKDGKLQQAIHLLKYQGMHTIGSAFGREIGQKIRNQHPFNKTNYIIPVPLHKLKLRERGYNQSIFIGKGLSEITGIRFHASLLHRIRYTESQTKLDIDRRKDNVSDAFELNPKFNTIIGGKSFIIVDDIITTGSTISECGRILKRHGASSVYAASIGLAE
ncbi:MAG: ComF family protein [Bacteroidota bacterium]